MAWLGEISLRDINRLILRSKCGGNSAWHKAAKGSQLDVIKNMAEFIQRCFDSPQTKDPARDQLLRIGSTAKYVIKQLINVPNYKGVIPLMHAAGRGNAELVQWLLTYGKDLFQEKQALACSSCNKPGLLGRAWLWYSVGRQVTGNRTSSMNQHGVPRVL